MKKEKLEDLSPLSSLSHFYFQSTSLLSFLSSRLIYQQTTCNDLVLCRNIQNREKLDGTEVNYYATIPPSLEDYAAASRQSRLSRLKDATFLRTWALRSSGGLPTTVASTSDRDRVERLWRGRIPTEHVNDHIMVRDIGLNARGKLDRITQEIAAGLNIPNNCGT